MKTFQHDACATACMMYEQDCDIYYIDPGFQEYLFAEYYFNADTKTVRGMGLELQHIPISAYRNTDAFDMLYQKSAVKVEVSIYLPYLEEIFKDKTDDVAFLWYLCHGYAQFTYTVLDSDALDQVKQKHCVDALLSSSNENEQYAALLDSTNDWRPHLHPTQYNESDDTVCRAGELLSRRLYKQ